MNSYKTTPLSLFVFLLCYAHALFSFPLHENNEPLTRSEELPLHLQKTSDSYLEGYVQALIDVHYRDYFLRVEAKEHLITLYNVPNDQLFADTVRAFVEDIPSVSSVHIVTQEEKKGPQSSRINSEDQKKLYGVWLPQETVLFPSFLADPRRIAYSASLRFGDKVIGKRTIAVSGGEIFPIFRWKDVGPQYASVELSIEGGVWAVFNTRSKESKWAELVNTDFYIGIPLVYAGERWSHRLRLYHVSSHLGDEYIKSHENVERKNPSFEAIDYTCSYYFNRALRLYGGLGVIFSSDDSFKEKPLYVQYGMEYRFLGTKSSYHDMYTQPFFAIHLRQSKKSRWRPDVTSVLGVEWLKLSRVGKKFRLFLEYHNGHSCEGQFSREKTSYVSFNIAYGF